LEEYVETLTVIATFQLGNVPIQPLVQKILAYVQPLQLTPAVATLRTLLQTSAT